MFIQGFQVHSYIVNISFCESPKWSQKVIHLPLDVWWGVLEAYHLDVEPFARKPATLTELATQFLTLIMQQVLCTLQALIGTICCLLRVFPNKRRERGVDIVEVEEAAFPASAHFSEHLFTRAKESAARFSLMIELDGRPSRIVDKPHMTPFPGSFVDVCTDIGNTRPSAIQVKFTAV